MNRSCVTCIWEPEWKWVKKGLYWKGTYVMAWGGKCGCPVPNAVYKDYIEDSDMLVFLGDHDGQYCEPWKPKEPIKYMCFYLGEFENCLTDFQDTFDECDFDSKKTCGFWSGVYE